MVAEMETDTRLTYRLVLAVDIERYSARSPREQLIIQHELRHALDEAATYARLQRDAWQRQVHGDGELAILPENADISDVVGTFTHCLDAILCERNRNSAGSPPLRVRLSIHHGTLAPGPFGPAGDAPIIVSRLLDARPLRRMLADRPECSLALVVSAPLYRDVVRSGFCSLDPENFEPLRIVTKGVAYHGYMCNVSSDGSPLELSL